MNVIVLHSEIVDRDAIEIGELYKTSRSLMADSVRNLHEAGKRLFEKKLSLEERDWIPWLKANFGTLGFGERTAQRLLKLAKTTLTTDLQPEEASEISRDVWGNNVVRGTLGTGENEWYTPPKYVELARQVLGGIDLDPASSEIAQETIKATKFFTVLDDGLRQEWRGRIWLNPPYAQPLIYQFAEKMVEERAAGRVTAAIMLTHNYTDTAWFHKGVEIADAICFTRGRIPFLDENGGTCAPTQGQAFFYYGDDVAKFAMMFLEVGFTVVPNGA